MPYINFPQKILGFTVTKRLGLPNMFGWIVPGWSMFGDTNDYAGVYQGRHRRLDFWTAGYNPKGKKDNFMMKPAWPSNPQTVPQQAHRATFADGVTAWQALTVEQKNVYRKNGTRKGRKGFCLFMSEYLKSH